MDKDNWMTIRFYVLASSFLFLTGCATDLTDAEADISNASETAEVAEIGNGQGGPEGEGMQMQSEPKDSIIDIVEESAENNTTESKSEAELAEAFLDTLTDDEKEQVSYDFTEENAAHWSNLPANSQNRNGVALGDLSEESVEAALTLAKASLSEQGYETMLNIIRADEFLTTDTGRTEWGSGLYYIAILGEPSDTDTWMLQISGHHLAENIVFNGEEVSATPQFTGTEPQTFELNGTTLAPIETRRKGMYSIIESLDEDQLAEAKIDEEFRDVVVGADSDGEFPEESEGILYSDLSEEQQELVKTAIKAWMEDAEEDTAQGLLDVYLSDDALAETYIGWSGSTNYDDVGSYVRIDGPRLWLEFASQQGVGYNSGEDAEAHFHTVWRDKLADYGGAFSE
ncbi:DUF3500 domain-containing protein [Terribacillus saccharophilus]|uniref:DUF3500 domain-containing protein n=1 Tax=Terribacillus saccharophilus TaxID=361277 RepID=A0ABX4GZ13_9BACI|nr:DUF3500 domain-containing protein [Terribacillus saccharophilus]PAD35493.1 hypothetical protein CHH56_08500 [Terribacillus saccharophilus]PAD96546.1 hypothetical protein CHH50_08060 [Terribacillus saccharophilus]PAE00122.1 hypothetical protein CHH48_08965 [Terribacillus saccharophilus]